MANADGNPLLITDTDSSGATLDSFSYAYNYADSVTSESDYSGLSTSYTYNDQGELISANLITYNFDPPGNPSNTGDTPAAGNELSTFVDPITGDTLDYTYDAAGNELTKTDVTAGIQWTYGYNNNNNNQMTSATEATTGGSPTTMETVAYEYDAFGNLMKEAVTPYSGGIAGSTTTTEFAVDGWNPAKVGSTGNAAFDTWAIMNSSGALQTRNVVGNGIDQYLARLDNNTNGAADATGAYWLLTDKDSSVRDVLDNTANDPPVDQISYNAWGTPTQSAPSYLGRYGWDSYDYDAATQLDLVNARVYDPQSQRWMSQDPMGFDAGDSNLYRYVNNNPVNATDPSGFQANPLRTGNEIDFTGSPRFQWQWFHPDPKRDWQLRATARVRGTVLVNQKDFTPTNNSVDADFTVTDVKQNIIFTKAKIPLDLGKMKMTRNGALYTFDVILVLNPIPKVGTVVNSTFSVEFSHNDPRFLGKPTSLQIGLPMVIPNVPIMPPVKSPFER